MGKGINKMTLDKWALNWMPASQLKQFLEAYPIDWPVTGWAGDKSLSGLWLTRSRLKGAG